MSGKTAMNVLYFLFMSSIGFFFKGNLQQTAFVTPERNQIEAVADHLLEVSDVVEMSNSLRPSSRARLAYLIMCLSTHF